MANSKILTAEQEKTLRQPIEEYVGKIQNEISTHCNSGQREDSCRLFV